MKERPPKQAVLDAVKGFGKPFTVEELFDSVKNARPGTSRATVYRTIKHLLTEGRIWQVVLPSGARVLLTPAMHTKTLLYCEDCRSIECVTDDGLSEKIFRAVRDAGLELPQAPMCLSVHCGKTISPPGKIS